MHEKTHQNSNWFNFCWSLLQIFASSSKLFFKNFSKSKCWFQRGPWNDYEALPLFETILIVPCYTIPFTMFLLVMVVILRQKAQSRKRQLFLWLVSMILVLKQSDFESREIQKLLDDAGKTYTWTLSQKDITSYGSDSGVYEKICKNWILKELLCKMKESIFSAGREASLSEAVNVVEKIFVPTTME